MNRILFSFLVAAFVCLGCSSSGDSNSGNAAAGGTQAQGNIVVKNESHLMVIDMGSKNANQFPATETFFSPGVNVSQAGTIGDLWGYGQGEDTWKITVRNLSNQALQNFVIGNADSMPLGPAVLNGDGTILAFAVNELSAGTGNRMDRVYFYQLPEGRKIQTLDGYQSVVFSASGEIFLRVEDAVHVFDSQFQKKETLAILVEAQFGSYQVSADGRYVAFNKDSNIQIFDRQRNTSWVATTSNGRASSTPVFSPDGRWLAFLHSGAVALRYLTVIPFQVDATITVDDSMNLKTSSGDIISVTGAFGWTR